jgi:hypothetical protein
VNVWRALLLLVIVLCTWLPRSLGLDRLVTPDKPMWLRWSAGFAQALQHGDLSGTRQQAIYPGVPLMWIGALAELAHGPDWPTQVAQELASLSSFTGELDRLQLLVQARTILILVNVALVSITFLVALRLLGAWATVLGTLLIALDPYNVALTRLFQVDGLTGNLMLLSLVAFLAFLNLGRSRKDLLLSASATGLALLTRATSAFLVVFIGLVLTVDLWSRWRDGDALRDAGRADFGAFAVWSSIALLTFVLLWPTMWVTPLSTIHELAGVGLGAAEAAHTRQTFFAGAVHRDDPGRDFYAVTYIWRTTPVILIGLALAAAFSIHPKTRARIRSIDRHTLAVLAAFALLYGVALSISRKKFDRYLIPAFGPLDLVAAWGLCQGAWMAASSLGRSAMARAALPLVAGTATIAQVAVLVPAFPYYLSYYNPLLGGAPRAVETMMIGWGEGFDQVAAYLNALPNADALTVRAGPWRTTFAYLFKGQTSSSGYVTGTDDDTDGNVHVGDPLQQLADADYRVVYVSEMQRDFITAPLRDYFATLSPVLTVSLQGLEYARLYDLRGLPFPPPGLALDASVTDWDGAVRLVVPALPAAPLHAGDRMSLTAYVQSLTGVGAVPGHYQLLVRLVDATGTTAARVVAPLDDVMQWRAVQSIDLKVRLPADLAPGIYRLQAELRRNQTDGPLRWSQPGGASSGKPRFIGAVTIAGRPPSTPAVTPSSNDVADEE